MSNISFCFNGWINGVDCDTATDANGNEVDVSEMNPQELAGKLNKRELFVSLRDLLNKSEDEEIEIFDFEG